MQESVREASSSISKYPSWIPALQFLMGTPAFFSRIALSSRVDLTQFLREPGQRQFAVAMLGPLFRGRGLHAGWKMRHAYGGFGSIDVLAARSAGAHRVPAHFSQVKAGLVDGLQEVDPDEPILPLVAWAKWTARGPLHGPSPGIRECLEFRVARNRNQSRLGGAWFGSRFDLDGFEFE